MDLLRYLKYIISNINKKSTGKDEIMEEFSVIYKILKILKDTMDLEEFDNELLSPEELRLSVPKWSRIMVLMVHEGYVTGIEVWNSMSCGYPRVSLVRPEITLKGLEYLEQNGLMKKAANIAKGIKDTIPGL